MFNVLWLMGKKFANRLREKRNSRSFGTEKLKKRGPHGTGKGRFLAVLWDWKLIGILRDFKFRSPLISKTSTS